MSEDHDAGWAARSKFHEIVERDLVGVVDGIEFDFTGGGVIEPAHWRMATSLAWTGLTFPWDDEFSAVPIPDDIQLTTATPEQSNRLVSELVPWFAQERDRRPQVRVHPGDKVIVSEVTSFWRGGNDRLQDYHDISEYEVTLKLIRADGNEVLLDEKVGFVARDAMGPQSAYSNYVGDSDYADWVQDFRIDFAKIAHRIERLRREDHMKGEWMTLADDMLDHVRDRLTDKEFDAWSVDELVDIAATAGYALAKAEAEAKLEPLAKTQLRAEAQRMHAAKAGAMKRRKADTPELLNVAQAMCKADPNLSLNKCATELANRFGRDTANVRPLVRPLFERRQLPGGKTEYRPRRVDGTAGTTGSSGG
jgi:hypothetical protein